MFIRKSKRSMIYVSSLPVTAKVPVGQDPKSLRLRFVAKRLAFG